MKDYNLIVKRNKLLNELNALSEKIIELNDKCFLLLNVNERSVDKDIIEVLQRVHKKMTREFNLLNSVLGIPKDQLYQECQIEQQKLKTLLAEDDKKTKEIQIENVRERVGFLQKCLSAISIRDKKS